MKGGQHRGNIQAWVETWTNAPQSCLIADRAGSYDSERYPARNAVEWDIGWLKRGRHYDKYAQRRLDFLYLAAAWIWLKSQTNTT